LNGSNFEARLELIILTIANSENESHKSR